MATQTEVDRLKEEIDKLRELVLEVGQEIGKLRWCLIKTLGLTTANFKVIQGGKVGYVKPPSSRVNFKVISN